MVADAYKAYLYESDDGVQWQTSVLEYLATWGAGDLVLASGGERPYPALWTARHMVCRGTTAADNRYTFKVVCNQTHPAWINGPGAEVLILGATFKVMRCVGERRFDE